MTSLFDKLPDRIFGPLASKNRRFYAALLLHLYEDVFDSVGDTPRRVELIAEIGAFIERQAAAEAAYDLDAEDADEEKALAAIEAKDQDPRRYTAFRVLLRTGWLIELSDHYRKLVDFSPEGRLLMRELHRISTGDTRSYGGAVLNVLGNLDQASQHPEERSEGIRNAWQFSRDFMQHLRTVSAQMRRVEDAILKQDGYAKLFQAFFEDFVVKYLIADFKSLHTKNNPFRFRHGILDVIRRIEGDLLLMTMLSASYVREGRSPSDLEAERTIRAELSDIYRTFDNIDRQLDIIVETLWRIERRVHTVIRFMDREGAGDLDRATRALRALGGCALRPDGFLEINAHVVRHDRPIGEHSLYVRRAPPGPIGRTRVVELPPDPAVIEFEKAKDAYALRVMVTPQRVTEFLDRALDGKDRIRGSDIEIANVDDFIVFQRLREADLMFDGRLSKRFRVDRFAELAENDWFVFPDFEVSRPEGGGKDA
jgi:hypothetical protein